MELTKYEHACFTVEKDGKLLVVDPGNYSSDFLAPENVVAVVITHEHADHFDHEQLAGIIDKNPDAIIVAHPSITAQIEVFETHSIEVGDTFEVGPFRLEFFGGEHAVIHSSLPAITNLGVMINDLLYYPGDSFALPDGRSVDTLAIPAAAPWMKIGEAMDFLAAVHPRLAFPTHDAILSSAGKELADRLLGAVAGQNGTDYRRLSDSLEI
jgi:L-ascorbate metabolism protein UlaG (beta-lactamase superfamily)